MSRTIQGRARIAALIFSLGIIVSLFADGPAVGELSANRERRERLTHKSRQQDTGGLLADTSLSALVSPETGMETARAAFYVCPMHADFRRNAPGICGVCGMALQPVVPAEGSPSLSGNVSTGMPASSVNLTRRQADLLTLRFAEIHALRIERWIRTSARRTDELTLEGQIRGNLQDDVQPGQRVRAFTMRSRNRVFSGVIQSVQKDSDSGRFQVRLDSEFEGAPVYVVEIIQTFGTRLAIPADALLFTPEGPAAFKLVAEDTDTLRLIPVHVRIGHRGELYYEVLEGLSEGDRVAQVGLFYLDAASKLKHP